MTGIVRRFRSGESTLGDVARAAGVSVTTASRVLNGSSRSVSGSYRTRVETAAREVGYSTNLFAQAIARGSSKTLSLLVADIVDPYFGQIAAGVSLAAAENGFTLSIGVTGRSLTKEVEHLRASRGSRPRGVILATSRDARATSQDWTDEVARARSEGTRVIAFGPGAGALPSVHVGDEEGARALAGAVAARGYTRAVVLAGAAGVCTSDARARGFTTGFHAAGGSVRTVHRDELSRRGGTRAMSAALQHGNVPPETLVFAVSDIVALGAIAAARGAGRTIGTDLAFAGFGDIPGAGDADPALTTVRVPLERLGRSAALWALTGDLPPKGEAAEVVLRGSTPDVR